MIGLFKKIPPSVSVPLFFGLVTLAMLVRFFVATVLGALLLAVAAYWYVGAHTSVAPYSAGGLLLWFSELESAYKVVLFGSLVTVLGFVVAFHTATLNWRNQMKAQLKTEAAGEVENFFAIVGRNVRALQFYADDLIKTVNFIQNGGDLVEASFRVGYAQGQGEQFLAARNTVSQASIEVHRLIAKNHNLLASGWGLLATARGTADAIGALAEKMWIRVPAVDVNDPNHVQHFLNQVNIAECQSLFDCCESNDSKIAAMSGQIQGYLLAPIWGFSVPMYFTLIRGRKEFRDMMKSLYRDLNS